MKECFKCKLSKPLDNFYKHSEMADGHLNKCKDCTKRDVAQRYVDKREQVTAYERQRAQDPARKLKALEYQRQRRLNHPEKSKARNSVSNAIRDRRLGRQPCQVCGNKAQAHHPDYSKPFDVQWLCFKHHRELHGQEVFP